MAFVFLFITSDNLEEILQKAALKGVSFHSIAITSGSRTELLTYLSLHRGLYFSKPFFLKPASSSTKQGKLMGMGIPNVCIFRVGDVDDIVSRNGVYAFTKQFFGIGYNRAFDVMLKISNHAWAIMHDAEKVYSLKKAE